MGTLHLVPGDLSLESLCFTPGDIFPLPQLIDRALLVGLTGFWLNRGLTDLPTTRPEKDLGSTAIAGLGLPAIVVRNLKLETDCYHATCTMGNDA